MPTLLQLSQKRDEALQALMSAQGAAAKKSAAATYSSAEAALAAFKAALSSKTVKTVKKEERYEEESEDEEEDEEADEESDDEPKKPASGDDDDDDDDGDGDDDGDDDDSDEDEDEEDEEDEDEDEEEDEDEDEDEEARASALAAARSLLKAAKGAKNPKALASARANLKAVKRACGPRAAASLKALKAACQRITGKKSMRSVVGALEGLASTAKSTERLSADIGKLKADKRRDRVDAMLASAKREGRISRDEVKPLRAQGLKDPKWLKAFLGVKPKLVRSFADGLLQGHAEDGSKDGDPDKRREKALAAQNMSPEQLKIVQTFAAGTGKSLDDFVAEMNKTLARRSA